jgi:hypothetical protein
MDSQSRASIIFEIDGKNFTLATTTPVSAQYLYRDPDLLKQTCFVRS